LAFRFLKAAHFAIVSSSLSRLTAVGVGHVAFACPWSFRYRLPFDPK
jgi:hypothetical protein